MTRPAAPGGPRPGTAPMTPAAAQGSGQPIDEPAPRLFRWLGIEDLRFADLVWLALILALAAVLRFQHVGQPLTDAFSWREASTAMMADNFRTGGWNILYPEVSWTGPGPSYQGREFQLLSYLTAILHAIFGWQDWLGRLVAALFSMVTVFSLHRMTALVWNERHAHAAAAVYALMPGAVAIDSSFLPDPAMLALVTLGIWLFLRAAGTDDRRLVIIAAAVFGLGALSKLPGMAAALVVLWVAAQRWRTGNAGFAGRTALASLGAVVVIAAYYGWAIYLGSSYPPYHIAGSGYIWDWGLAEFWRRGFFFGSAWNIAVWWFYGVPLLVLLLVGLWFAPRAGTLGPDRTLAQVPAVWLAGGVLVYLVGAREITANPWNLHILHIPIAIFAGRGAILLAELGGVGSRSTAARLRFVALGIWVLGWATLPLTASIKKPIGEEGMLLGQALAGMIAPGDLVIAVGSEVGDPAAIYYARTRGWVFPPGGGQQNWSMLYEDEDEAIADLETLRAEGARWFGVARHAIDKADRNFVENQPRLMAHLDATAERVAETDSYIIYRLADAP